MPHFDSQIFAAGQRPVQAGRTIPSSERLDLPVILDAQIDRVHRDRDFGRVEARIGFVVKEPHQPVRLICVSTNVPARGDAPLRDRLVADAAILMQARRFPPETRQRAA